MCWATRNRKQEIDGIMRSTLQHHHVIDTKEIAYLNQQL